MLNNYGLLWRDGKLPCAPPDLFSTLLYPAAFLKAYLQLKNWSLMPTSLGCGWKSEGERRVGPEYLFPWLPPPNVTVPLKTNYAM